MPRKRKKSRFRGSLGKGSVEDTFIDVFPNEPAQVITTRKGTTETVNNSDTLQNDDVFFFDVGVNETWEVELVILYGANTAADLKWAWSLPTGTVFDGIQSGLQLGAADETSDRLIAVTEAGSTAGGIGSATATALYIKGLLVTSTTSGVSNFQWAQNTAGATNCNVFAESYMNIRRVS